MSKETRQMDPATKRKRIVIKVRKRIVIKIKAVR